MDDQALAVAIEELARICAAQPLSHRPDVGVDDAAPERVVEHPELQLGKGLVGNVWGHREA